MFNELTSSVNIALQCVRYDLCTCISESHMFEWNKFIFLNIYSEWVHTCILKKQKRSVLWLLSVEPGIKLPQLITPALIWLVVTVSVGWVSSLMTGWPGVHILWLGQAACLVSITGHSSNAALRIYFDITLGLLYHDKGYFSSRINHGLKRGSCSFLAWCSASGGSAMTGGLTGTPV